MAQAMAMMPAKVDSVLRALAGNTAAKMLPMKGRRMSEISRWFVGVHSYLETSDGQHTLTMCHFPMVSWNHQSRSYMIHGHIHENTDMDYWPLLVARERVLNAGCDINNFEPVSFEELVENNMKFKAEHPLHCLRE